mmetsp:Transcript_5394/g.9693  ORF Transcript_5394/g.9693 Transcript_5394/m.9693 type:complete len:239 (+) Transcript_5394:1296-2012(+)
MLSSLKMARYKVRLLQPRKGLLDGAVVACTTFQINQLARSLSQVKILTLTRRMMLTIVMSGLLHQRLQHQSTSPPGQFLSTSLRRQQLTKRGEPHQTRALPRSAPNRIWLMRGRQAPGQKKMLVIKLLGVLFGPPKQEYFFQTAQLRATWQLSALHCNPYTLTRPQVVRTTQAIRQQKHPQSHCCAQTHQQLPQKMMGIVQPLLQRQNQLWSTVFPLAIQQKMRQHLNGKHPAKTLVL